MLLLELAHTPCARGKKIKALLKLRSPLWHPALNQAGSVGFCLFLQSCSWTVPPAASQGRGTIQCTSWMRIASCAAKHTRTIHAAAPLGCSLTGAWCLSNTLQQLEPGGCTASLLRLPPLGFLPALSSLPLPAQPSDGFFFS